MMKSEICTCMQQFVETLGAQHGVDLSRQQAQLWVIHPDHQTCLLISNVDGERIALAYSYLQGGELLLALDLVFLLDAHSGWFPMEASYTDAIWDVYVFEAEVLDERGIEDADGQLDLTQFAEYHAAWWHAQRWVEQSQLYHPRTKGAQDVRRTTDG